MMCEGYKINELNLRLQGYYGACTAFWQLVQHTRLVLLGFTTTTNKKIRNASHCQTCTTNMIP